MKKFNFKSLMARLSVMVSSFMVFGISAFAAETDAAAKAPTGFADVVAPIIDLLNSLMLPLLGVVVAVGGLYCILLGVKFAKAEEPQDREKAKGHLKNAIIGFVLIFVLIVILNLLMPVMTSWVTTTLKANAQSAIF